MVSQVDCTSENSAQLSRNCKIHKAITFSLGIRLRHEYNHWKGNSKENMMEYLDSSQKHLVVYKSVEKKGNWTM
jgi:hypothetical protein